jgi:hypothetical protein
MRYFKTVCEIPQWYDTKALKIHVGLARILSNSSGITKRTLLPASLQQACEVHNCIAHFVLASWWV